MPGDPANMDEEEKQWVEERNRAKAKQLALKDSKIPSEAEWDAQRKAQAEKQSAAAKAMAVTPGSLTGNIADPWAIDTTVSLPSETTELLPIPPRNTKQTAQVNAPTVATTSELTVWQCTVALGTIYAHSWDVLKNKIKDTEGSHQVLEYKFSNTIENILAFFVPDQYPGHPSPVKTFEIIVQGGKVFRDEG